MKPEWPEMEKQVGAGHRAGIGKWRTENNKEGAELLPKITAVHTFGKLWEPARTK